MRLFMVTVVTHFHPFVTLFVTMVVTLFLPLNLLIIIIISIYYIYYMNDDGVMVTGKREYKHYRKGT